MVYPRLILPVILAAMLAGSLRADLSRETGAFVFHNYAAKEYHASPHNFGFAEDSRGVVYIANLDGLLEFDGVSWHLIRFDGGSPLVRSVAVDAAGTVFVGGQGQFGFLKPDSAGVPRLVSLVERLPEQDRQFGDIWRVLPTAQGVYFSSYSRLFRLNPDGSVKVWHPVSNFGRALLVSGSIYVKTRERGLLKMRGDELTPVPGGQRFAASAGSVAATAVEDAIALDGGLLVATQDRLLRLTASGVENFPTSADKYFGEKLIYSLAMLPSGDIAVGTQTGGLVLLNRGGSLDRVITKRDGLADDWVTSMFTDSQGGVWLAYDGGGLTRFNPGLSRFDTGAGIPTAWCSVRQGNSVYAGSTAGLLKMRTVDAQSPQFSAIVGINRNVWSLVPLGSDLLAATDRGISLISGQKASSILETRQGVLDLSVSVQDPNVVYAAGKNVVFVLRRQGNEWQKIAEVPFPGQEVRTVFEDSDSLVWATTPDTIWRIDLRQQPIKPEPFGSDKGVPGGGQVIFGQRLGDHLVFGTSKGLRRYSPQEKRFAPDISLGSEFADGSRNVLRVFDDPAGNIWVTGDGYHELLHKQPGGYQRLPSPLIQAGIDEIYSMSFDPDGTVWASGADSILYRWERALAGNPDRGFKVLTRNVRTGDGKSIVYGGFGDPSSIRLPYSSNALRFEFAAPFFEQPEAVDYQVYLEGSDPGWSSWSHESHKDYNNLREGSYKFRVRARSPHGTVNEETGYSFGVHPPWYRTWWAYSIYAVLGGFGVWGIVRWRVRQLEADKHQLEVIVEERTVEIREQRDEIHAQERKSNSLLLNILPATVADELKATGSVRPVGFDDVTVCFTDFVGFTVSSEKLAPGKLVNSLNEYFTAFDEIVARYGLEKMKTVGDSYMFASGLPTPRNAHAVDAVLAAMEMVQVVKGLATKPDGTAWGIRVGLHSGPVVAGVVGIRKFAFDIWGNTVNFSARMESSGVPGNVNMSERTNRLLRGLIETESRGNVKIKEGRELPMFLACRPALREEEFARRYRQEFGEELKSFPAGYDCVTQSFTCPA
jgi:class 3 adenylate cyclase/sugar lactone lactonase YvrE